MPSIAAANLYNFLKLLLQEKSSSETTVIAELKQELEDYLDSIHDASIDDVLKDILLNHGWSDLSRQFETSLDVSSLQNSLTKEARRLVTRTSMLGISQNNTCKSFVPGMLLSYLYRTLRSDCFELKPESFTFKGVCLLVDISGFTHLSGSYCNLGKDGIDDLQRATNGYMGRLVEVIYFYGLDIIKFAGDAIICILTEKDVLNQISYNPTASPVVIEDTNESVLKELAMLALCCAMDLRNISTELLTVHVAVSYGQMCFGVLGGVNDRWDCLVSGKCLMQLSRCLEDAPSRHVAITQELALLLGDEIVTQAGGKLMESGNYLVDKRFEKIINRVDSNDDDNILITSLADTPDFINLTEKFVPSPVLLSLKSGSSVAEIREVTTIFMKWDSYSVDRFPNLIELNPYFRCAQRILMDLGAFIRQFLVDDKGCVLIACFGVPTASHLDNAARALRSAVTIRTEFNAMNMECSFGITTGNVYFGDVGSVLRREVAVIGDVVNLAARLMSTAEHEIFIDENTYSRLSFEFVSLLEALPPMRVKGKVQPINVFRYTAETLPPERESKIEESWIKQSCKSVLRRCLEELVASSASSPQRSSQGNNTLGENNSNVTTNRRSMMFFFMTPVTIKTNNNDTNSNVLLLQPVKFVLIEGKMRTGKRSVARWLRQEAEQLDIRVISCRLDSKDANIEFSLLSKLFWLMVGQDSFPHAISDQRFVIMHLLREVYGDDHYTVEKYALPAVMRVSLGITDKSSRAPIKMLQETMFKIFAWLLKEVPCVIIIESMQYADKETLQILLTFREMKAPALIVFTSLQRDGDLQYYETMDDNNNATASANTTSKGWIEPFDSFCRSMENYQHVTLITLDDFNVSEIDGMLLASFKNDHLPLRLAAWVHQLSGGNIFWIKEIIEYLRVTTPEEFLSIIDGSVIVQQKTAGGHRRSRNKATENGVGLLDATTKHQRQQIHAVSNNTEGIKTEASLLDIGRSSSITDRTLPFGLFNSAGRQSSENCSVSLPSQQRANVVASAAASSSSPPSSNEVQQVVAPLTITVPSPQQQQSSSPHATSPKTNNEANRSKLDLFVICRFEKLSLDNQLLLKVASVIGFEFSRYVLYGILSSTQKTIMFNSLKITYQRIMDHQVRIKRSKLFIQSSSHPLHNLSVNTIWGTKSVAQCYWRILRESASK